MTLTKLKYTFELIKFSHSIFALPFALIAFFVASQGHFSWTKLMWVVFCVVMARTAAMAFNRLVDAKMDAKNPRTAMRHLPQRLLSPTFVGILTAVSSAAFLFGASRLNQTAFLLAPIALGILFLYSLTKRFTHFTQLFLGLSLGMAPIGAYVAVNGDLPFSALLLGVAVLCWVAGFDLLYALQDFEFDRRHGLHSLAVKLGAKKSFKVSALLHGCFLFFLIAYGYAENMQIFYWIGVGFTGGLLIWEHRILNEDLKEINAAFFTANGLISFVVLIAVLADLWQRSS